MKIPKENKIIANEALKAFGGTTRKVIEYLDKNEKSSIDIQIVINRPYKGITSYSTIGLYNYSIGLFVDNIPLNIEFVGACKSEYIFFPNMISTCVFNIINSNYKCQPGSIFPDVVKMYMPDIEMKHILFVSPFLWEDKLKTLEFIDRKIAWLMIIPISENEYKYAIDKGSNRLEDMFEEQQIDFYDLHRKSIF